MSHRARDRPPTSLRGVRVLTWNLWWRFGDQADHRQELITTELRAIRPDLCAFQEVYAVEGDDQLERLRSATGLDGFATSDRSGRVRFGNAFLSRYPVHDPEQVTLPGPEGEHGARTALIATVVTPAGSLAVAASHLEWRYDASALRVRQLEAIVAALAPRAESGAIPLLLGDLNAGDDTDELRRLTGRAPGFEHGGVRFVFTDSWAAVGDGPGWTWVRDNPNSADAAWPRRRIDHVLVGWPRPKPTFNPLTAELVGRQRSSSGVCPSDHYGVLVTLDDRRPFATRTDP